MKIMYVLMILALFGFSNLAFSQDAPASPPARPAATEATVDCPGIDASQRAPGRQGETAGDAEEGSSTGAEARGDE